MAFCEHRHAAGKPGAGFHAARIPLIDLVLFDVLGTVLIAWLVAHWLDVSVPYTVVGAFVLGTILHLLFCVETPVTRWIRFPSVGS
jgi:hypothetical protein